MLDYIRDLRPAKWGQLSFCRAISLNARCRSWVDAVEKGKNELTEIFPCVPVETGISYVSQRTYEGCQLEIGLIMCPPTSFSDRRTSASVKICSYPQKDFFNSIDPFRTLATH